MGFCLRSYQTPGFAAGTVNEPIELQSDDEVGGGNDDEGGGGRNMTMKARWTAERNMTSTMPLLHSDMNRQKIIFEILIVLVCFPILLI